MSNTIIDRIKLNNPPTAIDIAITPLQDGQVLEVDINGNLTTGTFSPLPLTTGYYSLFTQQSNGSVNRGAASGTGSNLAGAQELFYKYYVIKVHDGAWKRVDGHVNGAWKQLGMWFPSATIVDGFRISNIAGSAIDIQWRIYDDSSI